MPLRVRECAFTRTELLAVSAALLLIALAVAPAAVSTKSDSGRLICFNNLRLVGRGVQTWSGDHNQQFSWRTLQSDGGTMREAGTSLKPGNAWFEYVYLSNELVTPKILACPSDSGVKQAKDWYEFISAAFRANSVSYALSLDGSMDAPRTWLTADRHFRAELATSLCSARAHNIHQISTLVAPSNSLVGWTNAVHGTFGNVLTTDGTVEFTSTQRLKELFLSPEVDDGGVTHFLHGGFR